MKAGASLLLRPETVDYEGSFHPCQLIDLNPTYHILKLLSEVNRAKAYIKRKRSQPTRHQCAHKIVRQYNKKQ